jgi:pyruvate dehydrogenase E1 component
MLKRLRKHKKFATQSVDDKIILAQVRKDTLSGAYYLVDYRGFENYEPGDNVINIFAMGTMGTEALKASDKLLERGIYANVIMVTSHDLLVGNFAHENGYHHLKQTLDVNSNLHLIPHLNGNSSVADVVTLAGRRVPCVSVHDGEPGLLDNLGSIIGVKQESLAVRHHSKSGTPEAIYRYHHINSDSVIEACGKALSETALERIEFSEKLLNQIQGHSKAQQSDPNAWKELWPH